MLKVNIITIFPQFFESPLNLGILGKSLRSGKLQVQLIDLRDFTTDKHRSVDDTPFGFEEGMVMKYEPLKKAVSNFSSHKVFYLSPQGKEWNYREAHDWVESADEEKTLVCGRYSGVDQRWITECVDEEISVGDYVLSGGEPAALIILDSVCRLIKGVLGDERSSLNESFEKKRLLEGPQWTRPRNISGFTIPPVFLSGHHQKIQKAQYFLALLTTAHKRPDLLDFHQMKTDLLEAMSFAEALSPQELRACGFEASNLEMITKRFSIYR